MKRLIDGQFVDSMGRVLVCRAALSMVCMVSLACEAEPPKSEAPVVSTAESTAQAAQLAAAAAEAARPKEPVKPERPTSIDTELTDARRTAIEAAHPEAKGFVSMLALEEQLKKSKPKAKEAALATFDKQAKGKWVLFSGPMVNLTPAGFDLGVTYTPRAENDPMGMSRQFFTVTLNGIEGYTEAEFKSGTQVVVLAKYDGNAKASKGYELIAAGHWK